MLSGTPPPLSTMDEFKAKKNYITRVKLIPCDDGTDGTDGQTAEACKDDASPMEHFGGDLGFRTKDKSSSINVATVEDCAKLCIAMGDECVGVQFRFVVKKQQGFCEIVRTLDTSTELVASKWWKLHRKTVFCDLEACPEEHVDHFIPSFKHRISDSKDYTVKKFRNIDVVACAFECLKYGVECVAFEFSSDLKRCDLKKQKKHNNDADFEIAVNEKWDHYSREIYNCNSAIQIDLSNNW
jgi:hypothetical protein